MRPPSNAKANCWISVSVREEAVDAATLILLRQTEQLDYRGGNWRCECPSKTVHGQAPVPQELITGRDSSMHRTTSGRIAENTECHYGNLPTTDLLSTPIADRCLSAS